MKTKTAKQTAKELLESLESNDKIKSITMPSYSSPYPDCNASFTIRTEKSKTIMVHVSSIRKANAVIKLLNLK